ncbi:MAG: HEPN domain-containing protein [Phycisphaeraceae bacterium]|nr:MAG: HEPN domain-containing protein [Phycisphaeraceae bacterium]
MTAPREKIEKKVRQWFTYAQQDLQVARHALTMEECPGQVVCFLSQQAAEKSLKAFLLCRGQEIPHTHNVAVLLELCSRSATWTEQLSEASSLTPYAVATRYPGASERLSDTEVHEAVRLAQLVIDRVSEALMNEGIC